MYKLLIPAVALMSALACGAASPSAAELRADAARAETEADEAKAEAIRTKAEAEKQAREAAAATAVEWHEFQQANWNPNWDKFFDSADARYEGTDYVFERDDSSGTATIRVRRVLPVAVVQAREDRVIKDAVVAKFTSDKDVHANNIDVQVVNNVVHLRGAVGSKAEAREAVRLALNTRDVYDVVSHLTVK